MWSGMVKYRMPFDQQWRGLDGRPADAALRADPVNPVHPLDLQEVDVRLVDLVDVAVAAAGVVAVVSGPDVLRLIEKRQRWPGRAPGRRAEGGEQENQ